MSYIDSFEHVLVGYLAGLPVYRPLVDIAYPDDGTDDEDFGCSTHQLVLGGGSGEHPGLVLERPDAAMAAFALESELFDLPPDEAAALGDMIAAAPVHQRYGWRADQVDAFAERCRSAALCNPHSPERESLVHWLTLGFGEFAYLAMPDLAPEMAARLQPYQTGTPDIAEFNNILLPPPGLPGYSPAGTAFDSRLRSAPDRG
ncbi:hypothetical protein [Maricaulis sp.]|uniref:hypothetical protein n=1 Tax=Maricaulis sp. TaxID=1486257 RepID=UPI0026203CA8|nr:hypothetical protein [Maricaulis sp.]